MNEIQNPLLHLTRWPWVQWPLMRRSFDQTCGPSRIDRLIEQADASRRQLESETPSQLSRHIGRLRESVRQSETLELHPDSDAVMASAMAVVGLAVKRVFDLQLFPTQWHAGIVMSLGGVAEMQTGEGKTLAGVLPTFLLALRGRGVHVATTNEYLAKRDWEHLTPVYAQCGITTGLAHDRLDDPSSRLAYQADVTFAAAPTFGFDFLRDALTRQKRSEVPIGRSTLHRLRGVPEPPLRQRGLAAAIVDEADDVLIDDAVSPLILSDRVEDQAVDADVHRWAAGMAGRLNIDEHFRVTPTGKVSLSTSGFDAVYQAGMEMFADSMLRPLHEYVETALQAQQVLRRDRHYVVADDESIRLIDAATGRVFSDRSWQVGLQQAVQAKERVPIRGEAVPMAKITKQRFFRSYRFLCGMTGTAEGCQREFAGVYRLPVAVVPPRLPSKREAYPPRYHLDGSSKFAAIVDEAIRIAAAGRAVLIGTTDIEQSHTLAELLRSEGQDFQLLNGVQDSDEAEVIAKAGQPHSIMVATHLAGRGTDIRLDPAVASRGGLHVIVTQLHRSRRVDRQLIGRAARCGDPGSYRLHVAADEPWIVRDAPWIARAIKRWLNSESSAGQTVSNEAKDPANDTAEDTAKNVKDSGASWILDAIDLHRQRTETAASRSRQRLLQADAQERQLIHSNDELPESCWTIRS